MAKILEGKVVSAIMQNTIVVDVQRITPHPLYKKLMRRNKKFKVATDGKPVAVGSRVRIVETRPVAKGKHFKLMEVKK